MQLLLRIAFFVALIAASPSACKSGGGGEKMPAGADAGHQAEVDAAKLVEQLESQNLDAQTRLEAIHTAREAGLVEAIPALRELLGADEPQVVVAAAAALQGLDAPNIGSAVVEAAGRLSRERHFEQLRQLLFIVGDIGGMAARTYLEAVADAHQVPPIRQTAGQVLERMD